MNLFAHLKPSTLCAALAVNTTLLENPAFAKREAPQVVPAVVHQDVRYEVPHFSNPCGQNSGCLVAYNDATGALLWSLKVYCTPYDTSLETDVQDVFITSLTVGDGHVVIENEENSTFTVDPGTRHVTGAARGCEKEDAPGGSGSCTYAPPLPCSSAPSLVGPVLLAFLVVARSRSRLS